MAWNIDGVVPETKFATYRWSVVRGSHRVGAQVFRGVELLAAFGGVEFTVK